MAENSSTTPARDTNQTITGTSGTDTLSGGGGNDVITGGSGNDVLSGDAPLAGQWQYGVYTRDFSSADNQTSTITSGTLVGRGYVDDFNVLALRNTLAGTAQGTDQDDFGVVYTSTLNISATGTYTFGTRSDDGSRIIIRDSSGAEVFNLNNDFHQSATTRTGTTTLTAGQTYTIELYYWENAGLTELSGTIAGPGISGTTNLATSPLIGIPPRVTGQIDGNDNISGDAGNDTITGGGGNDTLSGGANDDSVSGDAGNDSVLGDGGNDALFGGDGADQLFGGTGNDILFGGNDADSLEGGNGLDILSGDAGDDTLLGDAGNDTLFGGDGNDRLFGGADSDLLSGGNNADSLEGGAGDDTLQGDAGNDTLLGGDGNDRLFGGADNDSLSGGNDADSLEGGTGDDTLQGDAGNDTLLGEAGNDRLEGGLGDDSLNAGDGADYVDGGDGNDTIEFGAGDDTVFGGAGNDLIDDISGSELSGFNQIFGGDGNDTIWSGNDEDTIFGGTGNDVLRGEAGNDSIFGDADNDLLEGGAGNDTLRGGAGLDSVFGGDDRDTIVYADGDAAGNATISETVDGGSGGDDFDTLDLRGYGWHRVLVTYDVPGGEDGNVIFYAADGVTEVGRLRFTDIENVIPCFTPGTMIATPDGPRPVQDLRPGDLVLTRDDGPQPIRWVGRRDLTGAQLLRDPALRPVLLAKGSLGRDMPDRDMLVSPQHRILFDGPRCEILFGESEVLVPAVQLLGQPGVGRSKVATAYIHLMFDRHQVILSDGLWTESFQPGDRTLDAIDAVQRTEIFRLFPELAFGKAYLAARASLKSHEARVLLDA